MKIWHKTVMIAGLATGTAAAAMWPFGSQKKEEPALTPAPEAVAETQRPAERPRGEGGFRQQGGGLPPAMMEKMKAQHEELMKLGEAARTETDPVQKEIKVAALRQKLVEIADRQQEESKKRLINAEKEMVKLRERIAQAEQNRDTRIDEQVRRILAGEPLRAPGEFRGQRPGQAPGDGAGKKIRKPAAE